MGLICKTNFIFLFVQEITQEYFFGDHRSNLAIKVTLRSFKGHSTAILQLRPF